MHCIVPAMQLPYTTRCSLTDSGSAMPSLLAAESTLTDRYQTTVPEPVRRALKLGKRDKIQYEIRASGEVVLTRVTEPEEGVDPVLGAFLAFLAQDIAQHPERLKPLDKGFVQRLQSLTGGIDVDLDAPLAADDE